MKQLLYGIRHHPQLWLLAFVPLVPVAATLRPESHTLLFVLSVLAIVPLTALLSHATESVAARTGDAVGGGVCLTPRWATCQNKHHAQEYNRVSARMQAGLLFLATIALLVPSVMITADSGAAAAFTHTLGVCLAVLLIVAYARAMLFSLKTHRV